MEGRILGERGRGVASRNQRVDFGCQLYDSACALNSAGPKVVGVSECWNRNNVVSCKSDQKKSRVVRQNANTFHRWRST